MISIPQIRAARGLLGLSQARLAGCIGISATAVNNIERGHAKPRAETAEEIKCYFESEGVEFLDGDGVRLVEHVYNVMSFDGADGPMLFLKDIIKTLQRRPREDRAVSWFGFNNTPYLRRNRALYHYYKKLIELGGRERVVVPIGYQQCYGPPSVSEYGAFEKAGMYKNQYVGGLYGGTKHFLATHQKIVVIESKLLHDPLLEQYDNTWVHRTEMVMPATFQFFEDERKWG